MRIDENHDLLVILGAGPSLRSVDHALLDMVPVYILNYGYRIFINSVAQPRYFGSFDSNVVSSVWGDVYDLATDDQCKTEAFFMLTPPTSALASLPSRIVPCIRTNSLPAKVPSSPKPGHPFSVPFYFSGVNAAYSAILMGYKTLLLVGVDCYYNPHGSRTHMINNGELSDEDAALSNTNYFTDKYHMPGDKITDPSLSPSQYREWSSLCDWKSERAEISSVKIYNVAPESPFDLFPRASLGDCL